MDQTLVVIPKGWPPALSRQRHQPTPLLGHQCRAAWTEARSQGYVQDQWLTFNQTRIAGEHIRKGEQSTLAVLYKPVERDELDDNGNPVLDEHNQVEQTTFALLHKHLLFNIEQTEGLEHSSVAKPPEQT